MKKLAMLFFAAFLGAALSLGIYDLIKKEQPRNSNFLPLSQVPYLQAGNPLNNQAPKDFVAAAENTVHCVVHVKSTYESEPYSMGSPFFYDPFRDFFRGQPFGGTPQPQVSSGSGVIISGDGYIVTNNHVISRASKVEVVLNDKRTFTADVVGTDPSTDLALLKVKANNLPYVLYGNSDDAKVGEWVLAVGNPFNLTSTVTAGIISAKARNINIIENNPDKGQFPIESFIQTDAAINPGNSGGALVNTSGQLIGINTAIASNTGSYAGYGFAIPVNIVRKVVNDLVEFGTVQRAFLGVSIRDLDSKLATEKGLKDMKGVYVMGLTEKGAAELAGIKEGDIITRIGNADVNNTSELMEQVSRYRPGDKITVSVVRGGNEKVIPVTLKNKMNDTKLVEKEIIEPVKLLGASFEKVGESERKKLGIDGGLKVVDLEAGKLRSAGIKEGFIITGVDKKKINSVEDLAKALENKQGGILIEGIYPNRMRAYYGFSL